MKIKTIIISLSLALAGCNSDSVNIVDISDIYGNAKLTKQERARAYTRAGELLPQISIQGISHSSIPGLYEVRTKSGVIYTTHDFKKVIRGELYDVTTSTNETATARVLSEFELKVNQAANQKVEDALRANVQSMAGHKPMPLERHQNKYYIKSEPHSDKAGQKLESLPAPVKNEKSNSSGLDDEMDLEMKAVQDALAKKIRESQSLNSSPTEQKKQKVSAEASEKVDVRFKMDGRVDPDKIENHRKYISYMGTKLPKLDFDKDGNRVSADVKRTKVKAIVNKVEKAGDAWSFSYKAANEKASIVVFTDPTCPFCKKLHSEIPKLNEMGITVYNLFYPRQLGAGLKGNSKAEQVISKMDQIWFAEDRKAAANDIYDGYRTSVPTNTELKVPNPVFEHYLLGEVTGMRGTPHILLSNGKTLRGYYKAEDINKYL
ncbi:thioredoxin fold domain-containing protein [Vibrio harveyi]|uniref:thioredoxin fold domain-containing protein n=1 Tax=Vibrio harveyi TaxID=669 RepID=UPI003CE6D89F